MILLALGLVSADMGQSPQTLVPSTKQLVINNRPLIKIQGKTISLMDIVKRMDMYIHTNYPQAQDNQAALYQFYTQSWRRVLDDMIMEQLILADSEGKDLKISDGDVRQEMDQRFGPDTIATLKKMGLSYEEAKEVVKNDMIVQRLLWYRVYSKAHAAVRPEDIKLAYSAYLEKNPAKEEWEYDVLTVRGDDTNLCEKVAKEASTLLAEKTMELTTLASNLTKEHKSDALKIVATKDYKVDTKTVSPQHKEILEHLEKGQCSDVVRQASRAAGSDVYRIFHLKEHKKVEPMPFDAMHNQLKDDLLGKGAMEQRLEYNELLRNMFGYTKEELEEIVPKDYEPFAMR